VERGRYKERCQRRRQILEGRVVPAIAQLDHPRDVIVRHHLGQVEEAVVVEEPLLPVGQNGVLL
jgi:hypothetical protein